MKNVVFYFGNELVQTMFDELSYNEEWEAIETLIYSRNRIIHALYKLHNSIKLNNIIILPFKDFWVKRFNPLYRYKFEKEKEYHFVLISPIFECYRIEDFILIQEKYNIKYSLILIDSINTDAAQGAKKSLTLLNYENIYTFDKKDAEVYKFQYSHCMYTKYKEFKCRRSKCDIYFIGRDKGRKDLIEEYFTFMNKNGLECDFTINSVSGNCYIDGINYNRGVKYRDVIDEIQNTKCIFEMVQSGQKGNTLRYYEAVCYNKKLLTNNPDICEYEFYDARFMKYYQNQDDIDLEWIRREERVEYNYNGEYSPTNLFL